MNWHHDPEAFSAEYEEFQELLKESAPAHWTDSSQLNQGADVGSEAQHAKHINRISALVNQLIEKFPDVREALAPRAQRAAVLAATGHVRLAFDPIAGSVGIVGSVLSASDQIRPYFIQSWVSRGLTCSCPDYQLDNAPVAGRQRLCKHVIAFAVEFNLANREEVIA